MLHRNEDGIIISADKLADVTAGLKDIEKKITSAIKKGDKLNDEENTELEKSAKDLQVLFALSSPELQKTANPVELMNYLKEIVSIKKIADKLKDMKND